MRLFAASLVCIGIALAGCNPIADKRYMDEGAGIELGYAGLSETTKQQDIYVKEVCEQAGYPQSESSDGVSSCMENSGWNRFVMAGINDINRRCDGYLTWLDAKRRDRAPVLKELLTASAASQSILAASGAHSSTLDIVSAGFALAGATYENWNSRLLLAINQSTVVDIVYSRQAQFVEQMKGKNFGDRPTAIYVLRNYLRLCMPTTIEADINTSMTLIQRGSPTDAKERPIVPLIGTRQFDLNVKEPTPPTGRFVNILHPATGTIEDSLPFQLGLQIQSTVCVSKPNGDFGAAGSETRQHLRDFKAGIRAQEINQQDGVIKDAADRDDTVNAVAMFPSCQKAGFASAYEVGAFARHTAPKIRRLLVKGLDAIVKSAETNDSDKKESQRLTKIFEALAQPKIKVMNEDVGAAIRILSRFYGIPERSRIDSTFLKKLELNTAV